MPLALPGTAASGPPHATLDRLAQLALAAAAVVVLATFRDYGLGWDDFTHAQYGDKLLALYGSGFRDRSALSFVNLYYYGGGFDMGAALLAKILPFGLFETRRLFGGLIGLVGLVIAWRLARRLGGPLAGLVAVLLLATCPLYVGHVFMNPKDGPFAVAMLLLLFGMTRIFADYPRPSASSLALFGVGLGCAIGTRVLTGFAVPGALAALALMVAVDIRSEGNAVAFRRFGRFLLTLVPALLLAYAIMALLWPWSVEDPLNPLRAVGYFAHFFEKPWRELFEGELVRVPDMPRSYLPTLLGLKLPEILLLFGLAGTAGALVAATRRAVPSPTRAALVAVALTILAPIVATVALQPAMYNGIRHFVFIVPPLAVLGGLAAAWLFARLAPLGHRAVAAAGVALALGLLLPVSDMARLHPYEYTAFNRIAGGVAGASHRFMLDYWGLALKQAGDRLRHDLAAHDETTFDGKPWTVAVCGPHPPAHVALGPEFALTWDPKGADFALTLGVFYCNRLPAPVLYEVKREGVVYARVYDLRGRNVTQLLTMPPP